MITPLPGVTPLKPGSATQPFPGIAAEIRNERGDTVDVGGGLLALTRPWPAMLRGIYGDPERYVRQYWNKWGRGVYFTGDGAKRDADGYFWLLGRVDDVLNVAGHRIGTMEVESALVDHPTRRRSGRRRPRARDQGPGDRGVRHAEGGRRRDRAVEGARRRAQGARRRRRSARSRGRTTCCSPPICRRRGREKSCAGCCATSRKARRSATRRRSPIPASSRKLKANYEEEYGA